MIKKFKEHIAFFLLLVFIIPVSVQIVHSFNHEVLIVCNSAKYYIHKKELNCNELHKQLIVFYSDPTPFFDALSKHFYTTIFIDKTQIFKEGYHSKKYSRGPPYLTVC